MSAPANLTWNRYMRQVHELVPPSDTTTRLALHVWTTHDYDARSHPTPTQTEEMAEHVLGLHLWESSEAFNEEGDQPA